jgi:hypothetical protein
MLDNADPASSNVVWYYVIIIFLIL